VAVLAPQDEDRFAKVTYTYYEQLNGYQYLKSLDIGYSSTRPVSGRHYEGARSGSEDDCSHPECELAREPEGQAQRSEEIMDALGEWKYVDPETGFHVIEVPAPQVSGASRWRFGRRLRPSPALENSASSERPGQRNNRDHVDIIIALGMPRRLDWIWCEHALTIGYRSSLTEIVQIIGRSTRDAPARKGAVHQPDCRAGRLRAMV